MSPPPLVGWESGQSPRNGQLCACNAGASPGWLVGPPVVRTHPTMQSSQSRKGLRRGNPRRININRLSAVPRVPPFLATKTFTTRYRFVASSALSRVAITGIDLFDLLCMAATSTSAYELCSAVRIKSLKIWGPMASDLSPVSVAIEYSATTSPAAPSEVRSDTSVGSTEAAQLSFPPPKGSIWSLWINGSGSTVFYLTGPANSIVDLTLEQQLRCDQGVAAVSAAVSGATAGQVYVRALDNGGSKLLVPIEYPNI